ncbi:MAG: hypothetical protein ACYC64_11180 [Armatimonadota bacterium]
MNRPPNLIWYCSGDRPQGTDWVDAPYWFNFGSSYLYPGPTAYLPGNDMWNKPPVQPCPYKPLEWRNPKRDILLADYWFDFHSGRRVKHKAMSLTPSTWVNVQDTKSMNILFLDIHLKACSAAEREEYIDYTVKWDNPHYEKEDVQ